MPFLDNYRVGGPTSDFVKIADVPLSASVTTIYNLPQTYRHLKAFVTARSTFAGASSLLLIRLNNFSTSDYWLYNATTANSQFNLAAIPAANADVGFFSTVELFIGDYTNTGAAKSLQAFQISKWEKAVAGASFVSGGIFDKTDAINSISFIISTGFVPGSRVVLYGIK